MTTNVWVLKLDYMKIVLGFAISVGLLLAVFVFGAKITFNTGENGVSAGSPKIGNKIGQVGDFDIHRFSDGNVVCYIAKSNWSPEGVAMGCLK